MSAPEVPLSEDEVHQISRIIETLNQSSFDYLELEFGGLKLTIARGGHALPAAPAGPVAAPGVASPSSAATPAAPVSAPSVVTVAAPADGTVSIVSPMIGRFYSQSEPGAAPYVAIGSEVSRDATVGLVEAMKMFNAVHAGVDGVVTEICVQDATLVEYGQVLFRVRPR